MKRKIKNGFSHKRVVKRGNMILEKAMKIKKGDSFFIKYSISKLDYDNITVNDISVSVKIYPYEDFIKQDFSEDRTIAINDYEVNTDNDLLLVLVSDEITDQLSVGKYVISSRFVTSDLNLKFQDAFVMEVERKEFPDI